jgi:hypothetical protein
MGFGLETMLLPGVGEIGTAGSVANYDTYVIGNWPDTQTWQGVPFTNVLNVPMEVYNEFPIQQEFEANAIAGGQPLTLASPINSQTTLNPTNADGFSGFGNEVSNFFNAGYNWGGGNFLYPPLQ